MNKQIGFILIYSFIICVKILSYLLHLMLIPLSAALLSDATMQNSMSFKFSTLL